jgi:hypothetical protein
LLEQSWAELLALPRYGLLDYQHSELYFDSFGGETGGFFASNPEEIVDLSRGGM